MMGGGVICQINDSNVYCDYGCNYHVLSSSFSMLTAMATIAIIMYLLFGLITIIIIMYLNSFIEFICVNIINRKTVTHLCP